MATTTEYAQLSASVYDAGGAGNTSANWIRLENAPPGTGGFFAATFQNTATGEIVIAYRGTDGPFDAVTDAQLAVGTPSSQFGQAAQYYNDVSALYSGSAISVTGHSLGGALASYVAATVAPTTIRPDPIQAAAFNAPGIANVNGVPSGLYPNINNYNTTLDLTGNGLETVPVNAANPIYFDLTGEGVQTSVGWVAPNDEAWRVAA